MSDPKAAARGPKPVAGDPMSLCLDPTLEPAVAEAKLDAARLHKALHRGLGDTHAATRHRSATLSGVPESYLLRLHKRAGEMTDVSGKYARLLRIACEALDRSTARADAHREALHDDTVALRRELAASAGPTRLRPRQASFLQELESDRTLDRP